MKKKKEDKFWRIKARAWVGTAVSNVRAFSFVWTRPSKAGTSRVFWTSSYSNPGPVARLGPRFFSFFLRHSTSTLPLTLRPVNLLGSVVAFIYYLVHFYVFFNDSQPILFARARNRTPRPIFQDFRTSLFNKLLLVDCLGRSKRIGFAPGIAFRRKFRGFRIKLFLEIATYRRPQNKQDNHSRAQHRLS